MKHNVLLLLIFTITSAQAQNIYTAIHLNRPEDVRTNKPIAEISEETLYIGQSGNELKKSKKIVNQHYLVVKEERLDDQGKLTERLTYTFDSLGRKITSRKLERWATFGYTSETATYEYDLNGYLIRMTDKNAKGQLIQQAIITPNDRGYPSVLKLYDGNGGLYGTEVATYNHATNQALIEVTNASGERLSADSTTIDFTKAKDYPKKGNIFNEYGDLMSRDGYVYERKYDEFGNWTTNATFKIADGKRKKNYVFTRKFKYGK